MGVSPVPASWVIAPKGARSGPAQRRAGCAHIYFGAHKSSSYLRAGAQPGRQAGTQNTSNNKSRRAAGVHPAREGSLHRSLPPAPRRFLAKPEPEPTTCRRPMVTAKARGWTAGGINTLSLRPLISLLKARSLGLPLGDWRLAPWPGPPCAVGCLPRTRAGLAMRDGPCQPAASRATCAPLLLRATASEKRTVLCTARPGQHRSFNIVLQSHYSGWILSSVR